MWFQAPISERRLGNFCHLLGCFIKQYNFINPVKLNEVLNINRENPEKALEILINELKCLRCTKSKPVNNNWKE